MCGHTRDPVIYSKFHRNPFKGFGTPGGQNLALPITLAKLFSQGFELLASCDTLKCQISMLSFDFNTNTIMKIVIFIVIVLHGSVVV